MIKLITHQWKAEAMQTGYWHDQIKHRGEWTTTTQLVQPATKYGEARYDVVCHTCSPSQENGPEQLDPNPTTAAA